MWLATEYFEFLHGNPILTVNERTVIKLITSFLHKVQKLMLNSESCPSPCLTSELNDWGSITFGAGVYKIILYDV